MITYTDGRYTISAPYDIGPRLTPSLKLSDGSRVSIQALDRNREGRIVYAWTVDGADGRELSSDSDLSSGVGAEVDIDAIFETFASFLSAWVESGREGENGGLLYEVMWDWAVANHEELVILTLGPDSDG